MTGQPVIRVSRNRSLSNCYNRRIQSVWGRVEMDRSDNQLGPNVDVAAEILRLGESDASEADWFIAGRHVP